MCRQQFCDEVQQRRHRRHRQTSWGSALSHNPMQCNENNWMNCKFKPTEINCFITNCSFYTFIATSSVGPPSTCCSVVSFKRSGSCIVACVCVLVVCMARKSHWPQPVPHFLFCDGKILRHSNVNYAEHFPVQQHTHTHTRNVAGSDEPSRKVNCQIGCLPCDASNSR